MGGGAEIEAGPDWLEIKSRGRMLGTCFVIRADLGKAAGILYIYVLITSDKIVQNLSATLPDKIKERN